jgi:signal transduction histidine kinase
LLVFARHVLASIDSLQAGDHICAFMDTRSEQLALIASWARSGIARHERCLYLARKPPDADLLEALTSGVSIIELDEKKRTDAFDIDLALAWWLHQIDLAERDGYAGLRVCSAVSGYTEEFYEALAGYHDKLNALLVGSAASAVCIYDRTHCPGSVLRDALDTHPLALIRDVICECPHYIHPDDYFAPDRPFRATDAYLARMYADTTSRAKRASWARLLLAKIEKERHMIARKLHDELGQSLTALALRDGDVIADTVGEALETVRSLAGELRPSVLDDLGLVPALRSLTRKYAVVSNLEIELDLDKDLDINPEIATAFYRIVEAALANLKEHAPSASVHVSLHERPGMLELVVRDNWSNPPPSQRSACFVDVALRCELVGGAIEIDPAPSGTTIRARVPP